MLKAQFWPDFFSLFIYMFVCLFVFGQNSSSHIDIQQVISNQHTYIYTITPHAILHACDSDSV